MLVKSLGMDDCAILKICFQIEFSLKISSSKIIWRKV